jgi:hypothetical protein
VVWWTLFKRFGTLKGIGAALKDTPESLLPTEANPTTDQAKLEARKRNDEACSYTALAMPETLVLSITEAGAEDCDWSSGKACLMVGYILKEFKND